MRSKRRILPLCRSFCCRLNLWEAALKTMAAELVASNVAGTRVKLLDNAGHALFVEGTPHFNAVLEEFLQNLAKKE